MVEVKRDPNIPTIITGDLNIPAEIKAHYDTMINTLDNKGLISDLSKMKYADPGFTYSKNNNFYKDVGRTPHYSSRLDYFLLKPGTPFYPTLREVEILKWTHNGRNVSDHFGIQATFEESLQVGKV